MYLCTETATCSRPGHGRRCLPPFRTTYLRAMDLISRFAILSIGGHWRGSLARSRSSARPLTLTGELNTDLRKPGNQSFHHLYMYSTLQFITIQLRRKGLATRVTKCSLNKFVCAYGLNGVLLDAVADALSLFEICLGAADKA